MSVYSDKVVKDLKRSEIAAINAWRKTFCRAFTSADLQTLQANCPTQPTSLWQRHLDACARLRQRTTDDLPVWPEPPSTKTPTTTQWKDEQWAKAIRHPYSPVPAAQAGHGLLVRPLVLAHREGAPAADARPVSHGNVRPARRHAHCTGETGAGRVREPAGRGRRHADASPARSRSPRSRGRGQRGQALRAPATPWTGESNRRAIASSSTGSWSSWMSLPVTVVSTSSREIRRG